MTVTIAIAGKGGSGKTTTAGLIVRFLLKHGLQPVLAVDADGNANLHETLGLGLGKTVGEVLAEFNEEKITIPPGMTKGAYLDVRLNETVVESHGLDLISMGRGEGIGCYCYPHSVLKEFVEKLKPNYKFLVMDNEAGMEHLSRRTAENIDQLLIVSDHSVKGVRTAKRILELVEELKLDCKRVSVVIARVAGGTIEESIRREMRILGIEPSAVIPTDDNLLQFDLEKRSILDIPDDSPSVSAIAKLMFELIPQTGDLN